MRVVALLACVALPLLCAVDAWASSAAAAGSPRRLVVCLDGTLNSPEQAVETKGDHQLYKPTNVLKTYRSIRPVAADGRSQITFYSEGVGSFIGEPVPLSGLQKLVDTAAGGGFGYGFERGIKAAYRFLVANHQAGDEIFVFGFSRGAAQAQGLVRFIDWAHGLLAKDDEYYIAELFDDFMHGRSVESALDRIRRRCDSTPPPSAAQLACEKNVAARTGEPMPAGEAPCRDPGTPNLGRIGSPRPVDIQFLGVWDTVLSIGSRLAADHSEGSVATVTPEYRALTGRTPPAIVKVARQALSIDEQRWDFRPQRWEGDSLSISRVQLWFPGVHSNIGGGYRHDGLANGALHWMIEQARGAGLDLDERYLKHFKPQVCGDRPPTDTGWIRVAEFLRGKNGRGVRELGPDAVLHESAAALLAADPTYRPRNLLRFLAEDDRRIDQFEDARLRSDVRAIVADYKAKEGGRRQGGK